MLLPSSRRPLPLKPSQLSSGQVPQVARSAAAIESDRDRLVGELKRMREAYREPARPIARPLQNALVLLTSKWSRASWKSREQLLKAAGWLLQLQSQRGA